MSSGVLGVPLLVGAAVASAPLGLPEGFLRLVGLICLPFSGALIWLGRQARPPAALIWAVIIANGGWVLASIVLLFSGWLAPTVLGQVAIAAQAVLVGVFAELQFLGLRRARQPVREASAHG